jgi:hypothetical protein
LFNEHWDNLPDVDVQQRIGAQLTEAYSDAYDRPEPDVDEFLRDVLR